MNIHNARRYIGDRLIRTAKPHRILDPAHGPLIAVKLNILTRKTLGGFETDLDSRVFGTRRQDHAGALRCRRGRRLWRRRHAWLSVAGRHVPGRLPVLRPQCRTRGGKGHRINGELCPCPVGNHPGRELNARRSLPGLIRKVTRRAPRSALPRSAAPTPSGNR